VGSSVYLETTAVIDASFKKFPALLAILESSDKRFTSQYAKMEIKKGFLNNLVLLHNKTVQLEKWSDLQQYISNLSSGGRRYQLGAILDAFTKLSTELENRRPDTFVDKYGVIHPLKILKRDLESFLRIWIRRFLPKIDKLVDDVLNPMKCFPDIESPRQVGNLFENKPYKCPESNIECSIKNFFAENLNEFNKILRQLEKIPNDEMDSETSHRRSALKKIIKKRMRSSTMIFSNKSQGEEWCWACGDAIHAVLSPSDASVVTRNEKHFKPICLAINRDYQAYRSPTT